MGTPNKHEVEFHYTSNEAEIEADKVSQGVINLFADLFLAMMNRISKELTQK